MAYLMKSANKTRARRATIGRISIKNGSFHSIKPVCDSCRCLIRSKIVGPVLLSERRYRVSHMLTINAKDASEMEIAKLIYNKNTLDETVLSRISFHVMYR